MTRVINIALEIKYGIVLNIYHNMVYVGESPYVEFNSLQEALEYMMDEGLPFRGTKPTHELLSGENLKAYASDIGVDTSGTDEEIKQRIIDKQKAE
jgi:hypothetical protein